LIAPSATLRYFIVEDGGANIELTVNLSNNAQNSNFPSIAVPDNTARIVWTHDITNGDELFIGGV
jgi:hypothetical protein